MKMMKILSTIGLAAIGRGICVQCQTERATTSHPSVEEFVTERRRALGIVTKKKKVVTTSKDRYRLQKEDVLAKAARSRPMESNVAAVASECGALDSIASTLQSFIPEIATRTPQDCCGFDGNIGLFLTHSQLDPTTESGFDIFWNEVYRTIDQTTAAADTCFVMTGYNQTKLIDRQIGDILRDAIDVLSVLPGVAVVMTTDPTNDVEIISTIRSLSNLDQTPPTGVWVSGRSNILVESTASGQESVPFIGQDDDTAFGRLAADRTLELLGDTFPFSLCLNARPQLPLVGLRCTSYYSRLGIVAPLSSPTGAACSSATSASDIVAMVLQENLNSMFVHYDCCSEAVEAKKILEPTGIFLIVGCMEIDESPASLGADFVVKQPIDLISYQASSWANLVLLEPDIQAVFPSFSSFVGAGVLRVVDNVQMI